MRLARDTSLLINLPSFLILFSFINLPSFLFCFLVLVVLPLFSLQVLKLSAELPQGRYSQRTLESLAMYDESEVPLDVIIDLVQHVHAYEGEGAILIFLSGWEEISAVRLIPVRGSRILYKYVFSIQHVRSFVFCWLGAKEKSTR